MSKINVQTGKTVLSSGLLQLSGGAAMSTTLTAVTDQNNTASPLRLSTTVVQTLSKLQITTADSNYIDAEDNSGNNRFTVGRDPASQQVNVDFASKPTDLTTVVGAIRTYKDGTNLSESMTFLENGKVGINTTTQTAQLQIKGTGSTSATTSLLVQNSGGSNILQVTDDRTLYFTGASASSLKITSGIESNSSTIQFNTDGLAGGYGGGYRFIGGGFNNTYGSTTTFRIYGIGKVGIGNVSEPTLQNNAMNLYIDNTQTGGRNKAIKLNVNFPNITTEYNGINFDTIENGVGGAFVGSQHNPLSNGYGGDLVVLATAESPGNTYNEIARFMGKYQSFYVGSNKALAVASAKLQIDSTTSGFLPPRMTDAQVRAIASPAVGLMAYNTDLDCPVFYSAAGWRKISHSAM